MSWTERGRRLSSYLGLTRIEDKGNARSSQDRGRAYFREI